MTEETWKENYERLVERTGSADAAWDALQEMGTDQLLRHVPPSSAQEVRCLGVVKLAVRMLPASIKAMRPIFNELSMLAHEDLGAEFEETRHVALQFMGNCHAILLLQQNLLDRMADPEVWLLNNEEDEEDVSADITSEMAKDVEEMMTAFIEDFKAFVNQRAADEPGQS